jgi:hypothetical protein
MYVGGLKYNCKRVIHSLGVHSTSTLEWAVQLVSDSPLCTATKAVTKFASHLPC